MGLSSINNSKKPKNKNELDSYVDKDQIPINCSALSEDGSLLVTGREDGSVLFWSARTEALEQLGVFQGHSGYVTCAAVQDTFVITGSADGTLRKWDINDDDGDPCVFVYKGHTGKISNVLVNDEYIFSSSTDKTARVWLFDVGDLPYANPDKAVVRIFEDHNGPIYSMIFLPSPDEPVTDEDEDESPFAAQAQTQYSAPVVSNSKYSKPVDTPAEWGDTLITGCADGIARAWSIDSGTCVKQYRGHTGAITCLAVSHEKDMLFTGSADHTVRSWNLLKGTQLKVFGGHEGAILGMVADKRLLYSASADKTARAWVAEFGDCTRMFKGHKRSICAIQLHHGIIFTACGDGVVRAFEAKSGTLLKEFRGHSGAVTSIAFADGKLFSTSSDGSLRLWDTTCIPDIKKHVAGQGQDLLYKQQKNLEVLEKRLDKMLLAGTR